MTGIATTRSTRYSTPTLPTAHCDRKGPLFDALDAATGRSTWKFKTEGERRCTQSRAHPPSIADGVLFVGSSDGYILRAAVAASDYWIAEDADTLEFYLDHIAG